MPPPLRVEELVPAQVAKASATINKTLAVAPVRGGEPSEHFTKVVVNVNNAEYTEALRAALSNTSLFRGVQAGEQGDLVLHSEIISQKTTLAIYTLLVHYDVRSGANGRVLWRGNFYSQVRALDFPRDPFNPTWLSRARARTVQDNVRQFIEALIAELPRSVN